MNEQRSSPAGNDAAIGAASASRRRVVTGLGALALGSAGFFAALQPAAASHDPSTNRNTNSHPSRRTRTRRSRHTDDRYHRRSTKRNRRRR